MAAKSKSPVLAAIIEQLAIPGHVAIGLTGRTPARALQVRHTAK